MTKMQSVELRIALPDAPRELYRELSVMLLDSLSALGARALVVGDGDASALDADVLLIVGDCQAFQKLPRLLNTARHRPFTILWLLDSLPPESLSFRAERIGSRLWVYNDALLFLRTRAAGLVRLMPITLRRKLGSAACSALLTGFGREFTFPQHKSLDAPSLYEILGRHEWLRSARQAGLLDAICVSTPAKKRFLDRVGIPSQFVPVGYHPAMGRGLGLNRDIDVLFVGELDYGRRRPIVESLRGQLQHQGIQLTVISAGCYGKERARLLNRARIVLDVPRFTWDLAGIRMLMCMACGAMVVSEYTGDPEPFESGKHFVQARAERIPDVVAHYLKHEHERVEITDAAERMIKSKLTLRDCVNRVLSAFPGPDIGVWAQAQAKRSRCA